MGPLEKLGLDLGSDAAVGDAAINVYSYCLLAPLCCPPVQNHLDLRLIRETLAELLENVRVEARDDEEVARQVSSPASAC